MGYTVVHIHSTLDARINGSVLLTLDKSTLQQFGLSYGFMFAVMSIIENLVSDT